MQRKQSFSRQRLNQLALTKDEIHVWCSSLSRDFSEIEKLFETLSTDERRAAEKYLFERDRNRFIVRRGTLRKILAGYLEISPKQIRFSYNVFGKPSLGENCGQLHFNVSHSREIALLGIAFEREIGIDIEFVNDDFAIAQTADFFFSPVEKALFNAVPIRQRTAAFFSIWTHKEAVAKLIGSGFSNSSRHSAAFSTADLDDSSESNEFGASLCCRVLTSPFIHNYAAALATSGEIGTVLFRDASEIAL